VILAYHDQETVNDVTETFAAATQACNQGTCPSLIPAIETDHVPSEPVVTFYEEGATIADQAILDHIAANGSHPAFAGTGIHTITSYLEPNKVDKSIFPQSIREDERDVEITGVSVSGGVIDTNTTQITYDISLKQTASAATLKLQLMNADRSQVILDKSMPTASGVSTYQMQVSAADLAGQADGTYDVTFFIQSTDYFDRTTPNAANNTFQNPTISYTTPTPQPPATTNLQLPLIFGFSSPADVLNPGQNVRDQITAQVAKGVYEVPFYMGGNVTPDGMTLQLSGQEPDLTSFMTMIDGLEGALSLSAGTLRLRPYVRASLTQDDVNANPNGPGIVQLEDPNVRQNIADLVVDIAQNNRFNIQSTRVDEVTLDFEDLLAANYDLNDLKAATDVVAGQARGDVSLVDDVISRIPSSRSFKVGLYSLGILSEFWFPSENANPGSPFSVSPRNFIAQQDLNDLYANGLDVFEFAAYVIFPDLNGAGGFATPATYGPIHSDYNGFISAHIQAVQNAGKDPNTDLRILIPVYTDPDVIDLATALSTLQSFLQNMTLSQIFGGVFDFGSLDSNEQTQILNAQ